MSAKNKANKPVWWKRWERAGAIGTIPHFNLLTIKLGTGLTKVGDFIQEFKKVGYEMSDFAERVISASNLLVAPTIREVNLVIVSGIELGFTKVASRENIYRRAANFGLGICTSEIGLQLCLQHSNQPDEYLEVAMEPLTGSGYNVGIILARDGDDQQRVNTTEISKDLHFPEDLWVFLKK